MNYSNNIYHINDHTNTYDIYDVCFVPGSNFSMTNEKLEDIKINVRNFMRKGYLDIANIQDLRELGLEVELKENKELILTELEQTRKYWFHRLNTQFSRFLKEKEEEEERVLNAHVFRRLTF